MKTLSFAWRARLSAQKLLCWLFYIPFSGSLMAILNYYFRVHFDNLRETRRMYAELTKSKTPLLICSNHLTYIDSIILIHAFANHFWYVLYPNRLSWNLPAGQYRQNPLFRLVGMLCRCIFIDRGVSKEKRDAVLDAARYLLARGEPVTIFPEGRRTLHNRIYRDRPAYGIGKILANLPECRVLCCYMRHEGQQVASQFPVPGAPYRLTYELMHFSGEDLRRPDAVSYTINSILDRIETMERAYFGESPIAASPKLTDPLDDRRIVQ